MLNIIFILSKKQKAAAAFRVAHPGIPIIWFYKSSVNDYHLQKCSLMHYCSLGTTDKADIENYHYMLELS